MLFSERVRRGLGLLWLLGALLGSGCDAFHRAAGDEEREAHYVRGVNWQIQGQTAKAVDSFTRALHANPFNAAAHLALGDLHYKQPPGSLHNFIIAAYHYHEYLRIRKQRQPGFQDQGVEELIKHCELSLAAKYSSTIARQETQPVIEQLNRQIAELNATNQSLRLALGQAAQQAAARNPQAQQPQAQPNQPLGGAVNQGGQGQNPLRAPTPQTGVPAAPQQPAIRVHVIRSGDTPSSIARRYGVSLDAVMKANPNLNPRKLQVGQKVNVPVKQ